jgi:hypothetical protein
MIVDHSSSPQALDMYGVIAVVGSSNLHRIAPHDDYIAIDLKEDTRPDWAAQKLAAAGYDVEWHGAGYGFVTFRDDHPTAFTTVCQVVGDRDHMDSWSTLSDCVGANCTNAGVACTIVQVDLNTGATKVMLEGTPSLPQHC